MRLALAGVQSPLHVGLLAALTLFAVGCARTTDEAALRAAVADMADAVGHKEPKQLLSHLAPDFTGPEGLDREGVRRFMAYHFLRNENIHVMTFDVRVQLQGDEARVLLRATLTGGSGLVPDRAQAYDVASEWRRIGSGWQIRQVHWAPVLGPS